MAIFFIVLSLSGSLQSEEPYDLDTVLKGYRESFAWSQNVAFDFEISDPSADSNPMRKGHFFTDHGKRMELQETSFLTRSPDMSGVKIKTLFSEDLDGLFFNETIWGLEGDVVPEAYVPTLDIYESGRERFSTLMITDMADIGSFIGYGRRFSNTPLPDLLTPENTTLQMEEVEGIRYCVLNASTAQGDIQLWLMPDKDYVMKKCVLTKEAGKHQHYRGHTYSFTNTQGASLQRTIVELTVSQYHYQDGHFFPVEMEKFKVDQFEGGEDFTLNRVCRITTMDLDPDFEALQAFESTFSEESEVTFHKKDGTRLYGFSLEDGKPVANIDSVTLDDNIRTALSQIKTGSPSKNENKGGVSLQMDGLDGVSGFLFRHGRLLTWIVGALLLLACGAVGTFTYISGKGKADMTASETVAVEESSTSTKDREEHE